MDVLLILARYWSPSLLTFSWYSSVSIVAFIPSSPLRYSSSSLAYSLLQILSWACIIVASMITNNTCRDVSIKSSIKFAYISSAVPLSKLKFLSFNSTAFSVEARRMRAEHIYRRPATICMLLQKSLDGRLLSHL